MGKRGPVPKGKVRIRWSSNFAYAIGLFTADGCLSKDGRHLDFTSADRAQVATFRRCLGINTKISEKFSGAGNLSYHTQFGDVLFYKFLLSIGLMPSKSKTISQIAIPRPYFRDFLRGLFDGDGCSYSYYDAAFKESFRFYISFASASHSFMKWLHEQAKSFMPVKGSVVVNKKTSYYQLRFSKEDAQKVTAFMYWNPRVSHLSRKKLKINRTMRIINKPARVV